MTKTYYLPGAVLISGNIGTKKKKTGIFGKKQAFGGWWYVISHSQLVKIIYIDCLFFAGIHMNAFFNCFEFNKISGAYDYIMYVVSKEVPVFLTGNLFKVELILFLGEKGRREEVKIKWQWKICQKVSQVMLTDLAQDPISTQQRYIEPS